MRIGEANRNSYSPLYQPMQPASRREAGQTEAPQGNLPSAASEQDTVTITVDERQRLKKEALQKQQEARQELDSFQRLLESSDKQAEAAGEAARIRIKCMVIAARIMSGDKVPLEDYRYLAKNDPELYGKSITMRIERDKPKKYDRLSEDEEEGAVYSDSVSEDDVSPLPMEEGSTEVSEEVPQ